MHDLSHAVRNVLAPIRGADGDVYDQAVGYVADGTAPDVLTVLPDLERKQRTLIGKPDGYFSADTVNAVGALHPGWTREAADAERVVIYRSAPADMLERFGRLLYATCEKPAHSEAPWLVALVDDVARLAFRRSKVPGNEKEAAVERWTPDFVGDLARAAGVPDADAPRLVLSVLLPHEDHRSAYTDRRAVAETAAAGDFLARNREELARITAELDWNGKAYVLRLCRPRREDHVGLLAGMAVDESPNVRAEALAALAWLDARTQVELLAPHLRSAAPDVLRETVGRLSDLDGGLAAIEDALEAAASGPRDAAREGLLHGAVDRVKNVRAPAPELAVPPYAPPEDGELADELRTRAAASRHEEARFWPGVEKRLAMLGDVRVLRDALAAAGMTDADRRTASLLVTRTWGAFGRLIGGVLTHEDADRWWPLFAERPDLAQEYLELADEDLVHRDHPIDTTAMMLKILERFPAVPEGLVPRLADFALGRTRHRRRARRALANHPRTRAIVEGGLSDEDDRVRASAAEWLAELGDTGVAPPERGWEFAPAVLAEAVHTLPEDALAKLDRFREQALAQGLPQVDVDRWLGLARPCATLTRGGDGPVAARLGGPLMLPPDAPTPMNAEEDEDDEDDEGPLHHQLLATIDLSAIPPEAIGLPTPADGHLLLFANPDLEPDPAGGAVYVPAGTPVEERPTAPDYEPYEYDSPDDLDEHLRAEGRLRVGYDVTLPCAAFKRGFLAAHPHATALADVWKDMQGEYGSAEWRVGGHAWDYEDWGDPAVRSGGSVDGTQPEDGVLLAQWDGLPMASLYWTITRQDLAARRFDRVDVDMYSNP